MTGIGTIDLDLLTKLHKSGRVLFHEPDNFNKFKIPDELKVRWKAYIEAKKALITTMKKYNIT